LPKSTISRCSIHATAKARSVELEFTCKRLHQAAWASLEGSMKSHVAASANSMKVTSSPAAVCGRRIAARYDDRTSTSIEPVDEELFDAEGQHFRGRSGAITRCDLRGRPTEKVLNAPLPQ